MSDGAVVALVLTGVVVVGGGAYFMLRRKPLSRYNAPLPVARTTYGQAAALAGPSMASQALGAATSLADAYISSDAGSEQIANWLGGL